jgi:hypothetical protein
MANDVLPDESSLNAEIHYFSETKKLKIVSVTTNFDPYREAFLLGFTTGYEDIVHGTLTPLDFKDKKAKVAFFCGVGYRFGIRIAKQDLTNQPNQTLAPTRTSVTPPASAGILPAARVAHF